MADFVAQRGMTGDPIGATLRDGAGTVIDLTNWTLPKFWMWPHDDFTAPVVNGATAVIVSATAGTMRYDWAANDLNTVGFYLASFGATSPDAKPLRFPAQGYITIDIQERGGT